MKRFFVIGLFVLTAIFAVGCGTTPPSENTSSSVTRGKTLFTNNCSPCHGANARGVHGLGKDLSTSDFVKSQTDTQLLDFMQKGRLASDLASTTKVDMPPKGGNPALTDNDLQDIIAYIRTVSK